MTVFVRDKALQLVVEREALEVEAAHHFLTVNGLRVLKLVDTLLLGSHYSCRLVNLAKNLIVFGVSHIADTLLQIALMVHYLLLDGENVRRRLRMLVQVKVRQHLVVMATSRVRVIQLALLGS